jgi:outer membrane protein TolC
LFSRILAVLRLSAAVLVAGICLHAHAQGASSQPPLTLTLQDALARAKANSVQFQLALTERGLAHEDKVQARAALLPSVNYSNSYIYTEGNGTASGVFIANNGVHEYLSQGDVHQVVGLSQISDYRRTQALEAVARAKAEIAARGLVVTVVQTYYGLIAAQHRYANVQQAALEAQKFVLLSQKLENGGEVAHADVIKAQIQYQDRQRDLREAELGMEKTRLDLAVLLFPNFNENFTIVDDTQLAPPLQSFDDVSRLAEIKNPELRAASAFAQAAGFEVSASRGALFPTLTLDYFYGIDALHFATQSTIFVPERLRVNNLGYSATATLSIPLWNWGANRSKVIQADLRRKQAERELSLAQRKLLAEIRSIYQEAEAARYELDLLKSSAELASESLRLTTLRYQAGEATVLEVVDAQNTLTTEQNAYSDAQLRYRLALANLQTLTGTM